VIEQSQFDLQSNNLYLDEFAFVAFLSSHILRHRHTTIPLLLAEPEMIGIDEVLDLVLDFANLSGYILLGEELFFPVVVDLLIANAADKLGFVAFVDCSLIIVGFLRLLLLVPTS